MPSRHKQSAKEHAAAGNKRRKSSTSHPPSSSPPPVSAGPSCHHHDDEARQRVMNNQVLCDYQGDIASSLMDLVSKIDTHEASAPQARQRDELVYYVVRFLELKAQAGVGDGEMRAEVRAVNALFDDYTTGLRADEKGSPYAKLISIYWRNMRRAERRSSCTTSRSDG